MEAESGNKYTSLLTPLVASNEREREGGVLKKNERLEHHFRGDFTLEDSPSYEVLNQHNLLTKKYRVASEHDLVLKEPNSSRLHNLLTRLLYGPFSFCVLSNFEVPNGCIRKGVDGRGNFLLFGPGVHQVVDPFYKVGSRDICTFAVSVLLVALRTDESFSPRKKVTLTKISFMVIGTSLR